MGYQGSVGTTACALPSFGGATGDLRKRKSVSVFLKANVGVPVWHLGSHWNVCVVQISTTSPSDCPRADVRAQCSNDGVISST